MFQYEKPFFRHYLYIGAVDNNNYVCQYSRAKHSVGLNNVYIIHKCGIRVFVFLWHA